VSQQDRGPSLGSQPYPTVIMDIPPNWDPALVSNITGPYLVN